MKKVLITGVSRGIGRAIAEKFLSEGWFVIGSSTSGKTPIQQQNIRCHKLNLLDPKSIEKFAEEIISSKTKIDVLINNAGIYLESDQFPIPEETLRKTLEVDLIGLIMLTEKLLPLISQGGHIISMASGYASLTQAYRNDAPSYSIAKAAVNMFTRQLASYLQGRNITVSSLDPGWVRTDMGGATAPRDPAAPAKEMYELATSKVDSGYFWHRGKKRSW